MAFNPQDYDVKPTELLLSIVEYIQALRDVPQQPNFPHEIIWPILEQPHEN